MLMKERLAIVLVRPQGDANIGATARAMKNFGFCDLRLVDPVPHLTRTAYMWSVEAQDVLESAKTFASLDSALGDVPCAVAFTRRLGKTRRQSMDMAKAAPWIRQKALSGGIALVFGREDKGLTNDEIRKCDAIVTIPTSAKLPSLNLAQSIVIACYELFQSKQKKKRTARNENMSEKFVPKKDVEGVMKRLDSMLDSLGYADKDSKLLKARIFHRFEKLFGRGGLTIRDVRMFEGLVARIVSPPLPASFK